MWWTFAEPNEDALGELEEIGDCTILPDDADDHLNPMPYNWPTQPAKPNDSNDRGRGRTVETQTGGLAVLRTQWNWEVHLRQFSVHEQEGA